MADIFDEAQEKEEREREASLNRQRLATRDRPGDGWCARCGVEIPAARLNAVPHATTCVDCQEEIEALR